MPIIKVLFRTKVKSQNRITIPQTACDDIGIKEDDDVTVAVMKTQKA
jgi:bifunctional DNA-binding transcriptional regulator/antitoxin component of YhaV-PrlF toxin-antitoxin module